MRVGYGIVALAALVGLRAVIDAGGESAATTSPPTTFPRSTSVPPRATTDPLPSFVAGSSGSAPIITDVAGVVGTARFPGGPGSGPDVASSSETFVYRVAGRNYVLEGLPAALRPSVNHSPVISAPTQVDRTAGASPIPGVAVSDADDGGSDVGVLLVAPWGRITMAHSPGIQFLGPQGDSWVAFSGSIDAVNTALAGLQVDPGQDHPVLTIMANDFGHGDLSRARHVVREVTVR